jgi:hypothetical protein
LSSELVASPPAGALVVGSAALVVATPGAAEPEESLPDEHAAMARATATAAPASRRSRVTLVTTIVLQDGVH